LAVSVADAAGTRAGPDIGNGLAPGAATFRLLGAAFLVQAVFFYFWDRDLGASTASFDSSTEREGLAP